MARYTTTLNVDGRQVTATGDTADQARVHLQREWSRIARETDGRTWRWVDVVDSVHTARQCR